MGLESSEAPEKQKDVNQLLEELKQETEGGAKSKSPEPDIIEPEVEVIEEGKNNFESGPAPKEVEDPESAKKSSSRYIKLLNLFMVMSFPPIYRATILEPDDIKKMSEYRRKNSGKTDKQIDDALHSDDEMWPIVNRFDKYMKAVQDIPLDADEQEMLAEPLAEVLTKYKKAHLSPGWQLAITAALIMAPRIIPTLPDSISKIFKGKD